MNEVQTCIQATFSDGVENPFWAHRNANILRDISSESLMQARRMVDAKWQALMTAQ